MRKCEQHNCIELFAGAGGLMLGLEMVGFHTLLVNEIHPDPCETLRYNFRNIPVIQENIRGLSGRRLFVAAGYDKPPAQIDLIAGGPPCQGFSTAGLKDPGDPRNTLVGDFIRIVKELKPRFFLLENVLGLTSLHNGRFFDNLLNQIADIRYNFHYKILYAADHGVPQMRKRLIVLGSSDGPPPSFPSATHIDPNSRDLFSLDKPTFITCGEAIGDLPMIDQGEVAEEYSKDPVTDYQKKMREGASVLYNHQASKHRKETMDYLSLIPPGGTWLDIPKHLRKKKEGIQRWPIHGLSRAITTEPTDFVHPILNRIPTVREMARIQSFPDRYRFMGQRTTGNRMRRLGYCSQTQQIGNAIPPLLGEAIGKEIIKACS